MTTLRRSDVAVQMVALSLLGLAPGVARQQASVADQEPWISVAVVGAIISGAGNGVRLVRGRRAVAGRRRRLLGAEPPAPSLIQFDRLPLVTGPTMTLYHRADCPLVAGKATNPLSLRDHSGRRPCDWCRPLSDGPPP